LLVRIINNNCYRHFSKFWQRYEALIQESQEERQVWEKEKEEYKISIKERDENLKKTRHRDATEYKYNLELQRKLEIDEYEQQQKVLYKELEEFRQEIEKQWLEK
jgi:translation initiation factor 2B subunit (eIF-2B alpha/beta/delta family)